MREIRSNRLRLDAIVQWVKVVYSAELQYFDEDAVRSQFNENDLDDISSNEDH